MSIEPRVSRRRALLAGAGVLLLALAPLPRARAADAGWSSFTLETWRSWVAGTATAVVVFTSTDCVHCPAVLTQLRRELDALPAPRPPLRVVVTDGAQLTPVLQSQPHYAAADLRAAWRGEDLPLHHAVNPRWHGETPYVVVLGMAGGPRYALGAPSRELLEALRRLPGNGPR